MTIQYCHDGFTKEIFKLGSASIWAGARVELDLDDPKWKLAIVCAGPELSPVLFTVSPIASALLGSQFDPEIPWISLNWPDGSVPYLNTDNWLDLVQRVSQIEGDIAVYCYGGHGRTGTCLSIMASLGNVVPEGQDPVRYIRDLYCEEAVETSMQIKYIQYITDREIHERGSYRIAQTKSEHKAQS